MRPAPDFTIGSCALGRIFVGLAALDAAIYNREGWNADKAVLGSRRRLAVLFFFLSSWLQGPWAVNQKEYAKHSIAPLLIEGTEVPSLLVVFVD